jgi:N4-gp56 family major capsid protein
VEKYSAGGSTLLGEQGSVGDWRIIIVPEMTKWAGHGADASGDTENYTTNGRFDVFPMLAVGEESFTTISFQTDGQSSKFKIYQKDPGEATADRTDPFGETGFASIKWWYGFMLLRGERLAVLKTVARM